MWTWVSESGNLSIYQDLFLLLGLTYGKLWNVESQRNEYIGKSYNIYKWRNVLSRFQIYPATFFSMHNWLTDWLTWLKTLHLAKRWGTQLKRKPWQPQRSKALKLHLSPPPPPNNIFIITTLHLLPLLQISCWKKWTHTKDPGESWDSVPIGKPFNILKYNLTFLSIEEPPRGRRGVHSILTETF